MSRILFTGGGAIPACIAGGIPACLAAGLQGVPAPGGSVLGGLGVWSGGSAPGGICSGGSGPRRGSLLLGGLLSGGVPGGDPPRAATAADGTHHTGMHSCLFRKFRMMKT